jgi:hypothetical protein
MPQKTTDTVELLAQHEEAISRLYKAYAGKYPSHSTLWSDLVTDEINHAHWLRDLRAQVGGTSLVINPGRFKLGPAQASLKYVEDQLHIAGKEKMPLIKALSTALTIEKSILEANVFEVFDGDSLEIKKVLQGLSDETKKHRDRIQKAWEEEKSLREGRKGTCKG